MRASSFSNAKVINLLNSCCVPVHMSNQEELPAEEKAAKNRIYRQALEAGLKAGTVCAYLVTPEGRPIATAPLNEDVAADPEKLAALLERSVRQLEVRPGKTLSPVKPRSGPSSDADSLVLHIVARYLERRGQDFVPHELKDVLGTKKACNWGSLPSESWVVLSKAEWRKLLPDGDMKIGTIWSLPKDVMQKTLTHFNPPTENTDLAKNRFDEQMLEARVEAIENGIVRARLGGKLRMKHPFYHKDDNNFVDAELLGHLEFAQDKSIIRSFQLVTENGWYGGDGNSRQPFGAAVRSIQQSQ